MARSKPALPPISEKAFMAQVIALARLLGWDVYHTHDSRRSAAGFPDLHLTRGRVIYAELKAEKGKLSPAQVCCVERLRAAGQDVRVWRPSDWPEIESVLR